MKVIVAGSGGREHAISYKLAQSNLISEVICVPGNGGTAFESKCRNINPSEYDETKNPTEDVPTAEPTFFIRFCKLDAFVISILLT